jgi:ribosomal protein L24E
MLCLRNHLNPELDGNSMTQAGIILAIAVLGYWVLRLILEGIGTLLGGGVSAVDGIAKSKMTKNAERRFNQETIKWTKERNKHEQIKQQKAEAKRKYDLELKNWVDKKYTIQL